MKGIHSSFPNNEEIKLYLPARENGVVPTQQSVAHEIISDM